MKHSGLKLKIRAALVMAGLGFAGLAQAAAADGSLSAAIRDGNATQALDLIRHGADVNAADADGSTPLLWASYRVDAGLVKQLLAKGAHANVQNSFGASPLTEAVKVGNPEVVGLLLKAGAKANAANADGETPLMLAAHSGNLPVIEALVAHHAEVNAAEQLRGQTALMWAAADAHPQVVEFLLAHGARPDTRAFVSDWQNNVTSEPRAQYRPSAGLTALLYATRSGCLECVTALLQHGADINRPNPDGISPLMSAIDNLHFDIARVLLQKGANPNVWDWWGRTPLYIAVDMDSFVNRAIYGLLSAGVLAGPPPGSGDAGGPDAVHAIDIIQMLLAAGVDVNTQLDMHRPGRGGNSGRFTDDLLTVGCTPLLRAAVSYDVPVVKLLLAHGARVDLPNAMGVTPLMAAAGMGVGVAVGGATATAGAAEGNDLATRATQTLDVLLQAGADINARVTDTSGHTARIARASSMATRQGQTAIFGAIAGGSPRVVQYLLDHGATLDVKDAQGRTPLDAIQGKAGGREGRVNPDVVALIQKAAGIPLTAPAAAAAPAAAGR